MSFKAQLPLRDQIFIVLEDDPARPLFVYDQFCADFFPNWTVCISVICKDRQESSTYHSEQIG